MNGSLLHTIAPWIAFFIAITFHEFSHALAAYALGDDTARQAGRLTLNPFAHIDALGLLFLFFIGIGWARPVPMNTNNFKYPRIYAVLCGLAGPFANFVFALVFLYMLAYFIAPIHGSLPTAWGVFLRAGAQMNVMLGVFNMLPIPPLDGGHIIYACMPKAWLPTYYRLMPFFVIVLILLIALPFTQHFLLNSMNNTLLFLQRLVV